MRTCKTGMLEWQNKDREAMHGTSRARRLNYGGRAGDWRNTVAHKEIAICTCNQAPTSTAAGATMSDLRSISTRHNQQPRLHLTGDQTAPLKHVCHPTTCAHCTRSYRPLSGSKWCWNPNQRKENGGTYIRDKAWIDHPQHVCLLRRHLM
jgi:hypothetical protein